MSRLDALRRANQDAKLKASGGKVTVCPAGEAKGAYSLQRWRGSSGRSHVGLQSTAQRMVDHAIDEESGEAQPIISSKAASMRSATPARRISTPKFMRRG